jgi:predicted GNAT superfamily acetyltransferase
VGEPASIAAHLRPEVSAVVDADRVTNVPERNGQSTPTALQRVHVQEPLVGAVAVVCRLPCRFPAPCSALFRGALGGLQVPTVDRAQIRRLEGRGRRARPGHPPAAAAGNEMADRTVERPW